MQEQLGFHKGDKCVALTPYEWSHGFTLYTFKITDGPVSSGVEGPLKVHNGLCEAGTWVFRRAKREHKSVRGMHELHVQVDAGRNQAVMLTHVHVRATDELYRLALGEHGGACGQTSVVAVLCRHSQLVGCREPSLR